MPFRAEKVVVVCRRGPLPGVPAVRQEPLGGGLSVIPSPCWTAWSCATSGRGEVNQEGTTTPGFGGVRQTTTRASPVMRVLHRWRFDEIEGVVPDQCPNDQSRPDVRCW
jgi:hypothetical protein